MDNIVVIGLHGITGYRFFKEYIKEFYESHYIPVFLPDLLGFGMSTQSNQGDIESFHEYSFQIKDQIRRAKDLYPAYRIVIVAENMGALAAMYYLITEPKHHVSGAVLMNPILDASWGWPSSKLALLSFYSLFFPNRKIRFPFSVKDYCKDAKMREYLENDEYEPGFVTARFWKAMAQAVFEVKLKKNQIQLPVFYMLTKQKFPISYQPLREFYRTLSSKKKKLAEINSSFGIFLNDKHETVLQKQYDFLEKSFKT